ncbi:MAG: hypothetical protein L0228_17015 [Planctomycetes bacterium]|nr:hypothetical protein [Planctomycetota bacterium]
MAIRSENDPRFSRRFLFMGIAAIGFALYCLVDGTIRYPHKQERAIAFEKLYADNQVDQWEEFALERGWSTSIPEQSKSEEEYRTSIMQQYAMFVVAGLVGLWLVSIPLRARGRWIESTDTGITSSWGQSLNFSDVVNLEKRQWRSKGIAKVTYLENGRKQRFVLDDYKFDRQKTDAILYELEQHIDPALITGGPPESPPEEGNGVTVDTTAESLAAE